MCLGHTSERGRVSEVARSGMGRGSRKKERTPNGVRLRAGREAREENPLEDTQAKRLLSEGGHSELGQSLREGEGILRGGDMGLSKLGRGLY